MDAIPEYIANGDFRQLFIEELGWDNSHGSLHVPVNGTVFRLDRIAQKRGIQVFHCRLHKHYIQARPILRSIERHVAKHAHEHILIYTDNAGRRQVWQWATWLDDKRRFRHREHPFFSARPPTALGDRLARLRFTLEEEEAVSLTDAVRRVSGAFDSAPDVSVFFRNPRFIAESERLAQAMSTGGERAFHEFVLFHHALAPWAAEPYKRTGIEEDDLRQIAIMGLLHAARRYDPNREVAFSTYAVPWIRQSCQRYVPSHVLSLFIRPDMYWRFRKLRHRAERWLRWGRDDRYRQHLDRLLRKDTLLSKHGHRVERAWTVLSLDSDDAGRRQARQIRDPLPTPLEHAERLDTCEVVRRRLDHLRGRESTMVRMRFGFDGNPKTLADIGEAYGLTRERVRQRLVAALERLGRCLGDCVDRAAPMLSFAAEMEDTDSP
jgi:RNA polymerase sigma factor (sigma-70 family)